MVCYLGKQAGMNLNVLLDRMFPRTAKREDGAAQDDRRARYGRINAEMHDAWIALLDSPVQLRRMEGWLFPPNTTTENRVRNIVQHLVGEITDARSRLTVDVSSSKLEFDQDGHFIRVSVLQMGELAPFRVPKDVLIYIDPPAPGSTIRVGY